MIFSVTVENVAFFFPVELFDIDHFFYFSKKTQYTRVLLTISRIQTMDVKLVSKSQFVSPFIFFLFFLCMSLRTHCVSQSVNHNLSLVQFICCCFDSGVLKNAA